MLGSPEAPNDGYPVGALISWGKPMARQLGRRLGVPPAVRAHGDPLPKPANRAMRWRSPRRSA